MMSSQRNDDRGHISTSTAAATATVASSNVGENDTLTPAWRHLPFYEASQIRDASDFARSPSVFRSTGTIAAVAPTPVRPAFVEASRNEPKDPSGSLSSLAIKASSAPANVLVGYVNGKVIVCEGEHYAPLGSWIAFRGSEAAATDTSAIISGRVTHISCDEAGRAITLGEDEGSRFPILRIWDLRTSVKADDGTAAPRLLAEAKVQHGSKPYPVASIAHTSSSSFLAVGLGDGTVLLLRGLSESLAGVPRRADTGSASIPAVTLPKFKVVHQSSSRPEDAGSMDAVTGLGFAEQISRATATPQAVTRPTAGYVPRNSKQRRRIDGASYTGESEVKDRISSHQAGGSVHLFISTLSRVLRYTVLGKGAGTPASAVDDVGCALGCAVMIPSGAGESTSQTSRLAGKMVIAREEAIYVVGAEGREMSLAFEGKKSSIRLCATQLIIISPPMTASAASNSATVRQYVAGRDRLAANGGRTASPRNNEVAKVTIFDLDSKLVAYSATFEGGVRDAWADTVGEVNVLCDDGNVTRLDEKTLRQKLDILLRKSLYLLAVSVAKSHAARSAFRTSNDSANIDPLLGDIHRKYGDYLYDKGDFEGAISQFVKTIGVTQPSYVIRKFLDAQRITNLTTYLQELHSRGLANADHTTLLLNCFAKLKDVASLDRFIKRPIETAAAYADKGAGEYESDEDGGPEQDELPFDLDTAIRVCRQGGYYKHAAYLAQRYDQHDEYMRIQIEDLANHADAMHYVRSLSAQDAQRNLVRYGRKMLDHDAQATTDLLIELCSGAFEPTPIAVGSGVDANKVENKATYLSYLNVRRLGKQPQPDTSPMQGTEQHDQTTRDIDKGGAGAVNGHQDKGTPVPRSAPPSPRTFFAHFLDHQTQFVRFLETVALARWDQAIQADSSSKQDTLPEPDQIEENDEFEEDDLREQKMMWNTLLELYLSLSRGTSGREKGPSSGRNSDVAVSHRQRALALLRQYISLPYDIGHALVLCTEEHFVDGVVLLYERMGMYEDILRLYMDSEERHEKSGQVEEATDDGARMLGALHRYGPRSPDLYPLVLCHLVASELRLTRHQSEVERILTHIFDEALLSPLEVVQMLSKKSVASVGLLRGHLMQALGAQQSDIATNASLTQTYRNETREKQADIDALRNLDQPRIFQQSKCSACAGTLDLPSIHFMCRHSFHARCLGEGENECPLCAQSHGVILEIRRNNVQFGQRHDLFINEVEEAEDGFDVVASMFSKGLFGAQQLGQ